MTNSPTWYDLLDVEPTASSDEIRGAWKSGIADLEPGERRFDTLNHAAKVLLDPEQRAEYDAGLADQPTSATDTEPAPEPATETDPAPEPATETEPAPEHDGGTEPGTASTSGAASTAAGAGGVPIWMLAALGVLAVAMVVATVLVGQSDTETDQDEVRAAQAAAESAVVPVLTYDHRTLKADRQDAASYLTDSYRKEYDKLFAVISQNAPRTKTVVEAEVVASGIVRTGEDRVQVLVFVDRPTTNKSTSQPVVYKDQVTLTMQQVEGEWLVDAMRTTPIQE